jgi:glycosyltransferase involved in cell wall biosynthesis
LSGSLPIWIERILILFSLASADNILAGRHAGNLVNWLAYQPLVRKKLTIVDTLVDQLPSSGFFERLQVLSKTCARSLSKNGGFVLAYVGRLSREKMVEDLVRMMADLKGQNDTKVPIALYLIGDGPERSRLKKLAKKLDVEMMVKFVGSVRNEELPDYLLKAQAYVSPLTGTSLREAALCGLPIIAYDMDWIHGLLKHEETALLIPPGDYGEMARQVIRLASDDKLYNRLSQNVKQLAWRFWSPLGLRRALQQAFNNGQDPEQFIARTSTS